MRIATGAEMAGIDRRTIDELGMPSLLLMEHAGLKIVEAMVSSGRLRAGARVDVVCGRGNNAGDGFVVARLLARRGHTVFVHCLRPADSLSADARLNFRALDTTLARVRFTAATDLDQALAGADVILDALLGTGSREALRDDFLHAVQAMNRSEGWKVAVDIPTGLSSQTGEILGDAFRADLTVTIGLPKLGFFLDPGPEVVGQVVVADIGFPHTLLDDPTLTARLMTGGVVRDHLPRRWIDSHKYDYGRVLVVAGSAGMSGAAVLAARAALVAGAGLVTLVTPASLAAGIAAGNPEILVHGGEDVAGRLAPGAWASVGPALEKADVVLVGPGLSADPGTRALVERILKAAKGPMVIDADALLAVASAGCPARADIVLTPHAAEAARMLGGAEGASRTEILEQLVAGYQATVVLKGARTLTARRGAPWWVNPTGNPGLAAGGTGDVLAGLAAGLIAQHRAAGTRRGIAWDPAVAAASAVYLHGLAADHAARTIDVRSITPLVLLEQLPRTVRAVSEREGYALSSDDRILEI